MRLASYNLENLFQRPRAMNGETLAEGRQALADHAALNALLFKANYTANDKQRILELLARLGIDKQDDGGQFAVLRQNRGHLVKRPQSGPPQIVADGRGDWIGWVDLKVEAVNETATQNTARIVRDLAVDVLAVIEAESRPAMVRFSDYVLPAVGGTPFDHIMLIDGNDDRGIDVGIMTTNDFELDSMQSHVDDKDAGGRIFSRDCAAYFLRADAQQIVVLVNHFKSKGYGSQAANDARRLRQVARVKEIYDTCVQAGQTRIAVVGDFNDTPDSAALAPLIAQSDLRDVSVHPLFVGDGRPGTYANGTASNKIDYILLSPVLFGAVKSAGYLRTGVWGGVNGTLFPHLPELTRASEAASDHAAVWVDLAL